ncbi:integral membrane protein [Nemania sp. FL0916]|nr:integral membrane protein [Nemania sp. FL0916]
MSLAPIKFDPRLSDISVAQSIIIPDAIFTALILLSTGTRTVSRIYSKAPFGLDNYFILLALAFNLTTNAIEFWSCHSGFGRHLQFLTDGQQRTVRKYTELNILFATIALWAIKISISVFILSLIRDTHKRSRWVVYGLITVTTIGSLLQGIFWGLQAQPLQKLWNPELPGSYAKPETLVVTIRLFTAIFSITDLFYAISPIYFFGGLQMDRKKKFVILGLTGSGLVVFAISIVRIVYAGNFLAADFTWALPRIYLLTILERNLAQLIADLPVVYSEIHRRYHQWMNPTPVIWSSQREGRNNRTRSHGDSQWAIVTVESQEIRPVRAHELGDISNHGKDSKPSSSFHDSVERIV